MFEEILCAILILAYGVICYLAGKGNLMELIPLILKEKAIQLEKYIDDMEDDDDEM